MRIHAFINFPLSFTAHEIFFSDIKLQRIDTEKSIPKLHPQTSRMTKYVMSGTRSYLQKYLLMWIQASAWSYTPIEKKKQRKKLCCSLVLITVKCTKQSWPLPCCAIRAEPLAISSLLPLELNAPCFSQWKAEAKPALRWHTLRLSSTRQQHVGSYTPTAHSNASIDRYSSPKAHIDFHFTATIVQPSCRYHFIQPVYGWLWAKCIGRDFI